MSLHLCHQNWRCPSLRHSCDLEWVYFLPVPEGLPEPAVLLCGAKGIYQPDLSGGWSQHTLQCVLKTFHPDIPYMWLCWMPADFHSDVHTRSPRACGMQGHGA